MLKVVIIGAGLGGLTCAIACRRYGLEVIVLEQASKIMPVGAGIQMPPNASRVMQWLGLLDQLSESGCILDELDLLRYEDGSLILRRPAGDAFVREYGAPWIVVHRTDYHRVLLEAATRSGVLIRLGSMVERINFDKTSVELRGGEVISGDVVVGADGLWSTTRDQILNRPSPPYETGDLAYRATLKSSDLLALNDDAVAELCQRQSVTLWMGPEKHCVMYPLRGGSELNLVLLRPDNLPPGIDKAEGEVGEMRETFNGWDDRLGKIISCIPSVLKWRLCYHEQLEIWCKGNITILGDACHPTLPYQAQGAAMAVEDGAVLGRLLGSLVQDCKHSKPAQRNVGSILKLYESLRKRRTTTNVKGAEANRYMYHLADGKEQQNRDADLRDCECIRPTSWQWADPAAQKDLLGHDVIAESEAAFKAWKLDENIKM